MPTEKEIILRQILSLKGWRHAFDLGNKIKLSLERPELGPWSLWRAKVSSAALGKVVDKDKFSILDLACNDGFFSFQFAGRATRVLGLDVKKEFIDRANLLKRYYGYENFEFRQADLKSYLHGNDNTKEEFDIVLCYGLIYHLTDLYAFLKDVFSVTRNVLSLSTFLNDIERPVLTVKKEDISLPGSGLDPIAMVPSHQATVRLLYGVGFDLVLRYIPYRLNIFGHHEWGHFLGIKLKEEPKEVYLKRHSVKENYSRFPKHDQLVLCKDIWDINGSKRIGSSFSFRQSLPFLVSRKLSLFTTKIFR